MSRERKRRRSNNSIIDIHTGRRLLIVMSVDVKDMRVSMTKSMQSLLPSTRNKLRNDVFEAVRSNVFTKRFPAHVFSIPCGIAEVLFIFHSTKLARLTKQIFFHNFFAHKCCASSSSSSPPPLLSRWKRSTTKKPKALNGSRLLRAYISCCSAGGRENIAILSY